jgi:hypothetical protein
MTPSMQRALVELGTFFHPEPSAIFRRVLEVIAEHYHGTMAMVNLIQGERIGYRDAVNIHPLFRRASSTHLSNTY